ncbi:transmembrane protein 72 isoform X2 [Anomalospiza imberbis]|uniref:transmembrane protein 72 isoform X2 n=1 Tax=Anomalospiza imberbis TaxID=187417 RepID=UPI00358E4911
MQHKAFWSALEYTCRLLGISTAAVLIGVGIETLQRGQFKSLAFYLLFSGVAVTVCEGFFFISLFLEMCFTHKPEFLAQAFWKRARCPGSFQKFLGYTLLSVACFLHPVLVWHVTIPGEKLGWGVVQMEEEHGLSGGGGGGGDVQGAGLVADGTGLARPSAAWQGQEPTANIVLSPGSMLVLTALAYFLLSKRRKSPGHKDMHPQAGQYVDPSATEAAPTIIGDTEQTYTFHGAQREQHRSLLGHMKSILKGSKDSSSTPETPVQPAAVPVPRKQVHFQEKVVQIIPSVSEDLEDVESEAEETTSDTTPILTSPDAPIIIAPLSSAGLF